MSCGAHGEPRGWPAVPLVDAHTSVACKKSQAAGNPTQKAAFPSRLGAGSSLGLCPGGHGAVQPLSHSPGCSQAGQEVRELVQSEPAEQAEVPPLAWLRAQLPSRDTRQRRAPHSPVPRAGVTAPASPSTSPGAAERDTRGWVWQQQGEAEAAPGLCSYQQDANPPPPASPRGTEVQDEALTPILTLVLNIFRVCLRHPGPPPAPSPYPHHTHDPSVTRSSPKAGMKMGIALLHFVTPDPAPDTADAACPYTNKVLLR